MAKATDTLLVELVRQLRPAPLHLPGDRRTLDEQAKLAGKRVFEDTMSGRIKLTLDA